MSEKLTIPCPHCQQKLKIKDPRLLGKIVACPKCGQSVKLAPPRSAKPTTDDDEVQMELVKEEPLEGTSPKWVPDVPDEPTRQKTFSNLAFNSDTRPSFSGIFEAASKESVPEAIANVVPVASDAETTPAAGGIAAYRKRRQRGSRTLWIVSGVVALLAAAGIGVVATQYKPTPAGSAPSTGTDTSSAAVEQNRPYTVAQLQDDPDLLAGFKPTSGQPIQLLMVPSGVSIVVHLRPAKLWSGEYDDQVLRSSLTSDFTNWLEKKIEEYAHRKPSQIDELLVGLIVGARGSEPDVCLVMQLKEPEPIANLVQEFKGKYLHDDPVPRIKVGDTHAVLIHNEKTLAIAPAEYAAELEHWIDIPNNEVPEGIDQLLKGTDRDRLFTVVAQVNDLKTHASMLFPESALGPMTLVGDWLGDDTEAFAWSVHHVPYLHSELHLRPTATMDSRGLQLAMQKKFEELPGVLWKDVCLKMQPQEMRFRAIIGRFPAMIEAFRQATVTTNGYRQVSMTTVLPAKAAANLALGTMFTVNEASRTDFGKPPAPSTTPASPQLPETVAERLKIPVDVEFSRTPLEQAFAYLCEKIEVNLAVDGDALKDAGYTKNMPQTMTLGKVPVEKAFSEIVARYQEDNGQMAVWIDEATKTVHVTTRKFAERDGRTLWELAQ